MDYVAEVENETIEIRAPPDNPIGITTGNSLSEFNREDRMAAPADGVVVSSKDDAVAVDESKKSERKRKRERQRRSDLATAFEELSSLVIQIDPDDNDPHASVTGPSDADGATVLPPSTSSSTNAGSKRVARRKSMGEADTSADVDGSMTRLDLIGRTTMLLRRLQRENNDLRGRLHEYKKGRTSGSGSNIMGAGGIHDDTEVLVMVPTLTPSDMYGHGVHGPVTGPYPPPPPHHSQQSATGGARGYYVYQQHPSMTMEQQQQQQQQQYGPTSHNMYYHNAPGYSPYPGGGPWGVGVEGTDNMNMASHSPHHHQFYSGFDAQQQLHQSSSPTDDATRSRSSPSH